MATLETAYKYEKHTKSIDLEINREVYKLYGLSKEEIEIIENELSLP